MELGEGRVRAVRVSEEFDVAGRESRDELGSGGRDENTEGRMVDSVAGLDAPVAESGVTSCSGFTSMANTE